MPLLLMLFDAVFGLRCQIFLPLRYVTCRRYSVRAYAVTRRLIAARHAAAAS